MKPALLLVDFQADFLASTGLQPAPENLVAQAAALLRGCRDRGIPVIHVWTTISRTNDRRLPHWKKAGRWLCVDGTEGHQTCPSLQPLAGETIIHKTGFNGFAGGELDGALKKMNCDTVAVAGVHLHTCVRAIAMESLERGLQVFIAADAVASNDPVFAAATQRWLSERCVEFLAGAEILSRLTGGAPTRLVHRSPVETEKILFEIPIASADEISRTTHTVQMACRHWRRKSIGSRCEILEQIAARLELAAPELARQMAVEIGKPFAHGLEEATRAAANVRDVIRRATVFEFHRHEAASLVRHEPLGTVALISPWNNPVAIPVGKIAPALIYGNSVVWKPAPAATEIAAIVLQLMRAAGLPEQVVQILTGDHITAQKLAADKNIGAVTFTGSAAAGFAVQEICARRFLPLQAELSGNNAAIVWDDADLPRAAELIAKGAFGFAGQRCTANRRVIVSAAKFEPLWQALKIAAEKLNWGDPMDPATDIGPMIHTGKRDGQIRLVQDAQNSGAVHRTEFLFPSRAGEPWVKAGAYAQPVMLGCDQPERTLVQEETMSPLLVVQRAENFGQALKLANGVRHGLVAALFSHAPELQAIFLAEAQAGMLKINSATAGVDVSLPFGGWKMSGLGPPEHGEGDRLFYTRMQAVYGVEKSRTD